MEEAPGAWENTRFGDAKAPGACENTGFGDAQRHRGRLRPKKEFRTYNIYCITSLGFRV